MPIKCMCMSLTENCQKAVKKMSKTCAIPSSLKKVRDLCPENVNSKVLPSNLINSRIFCFNRN